MRQVAGRLVPLRDKFLGILRRSETRLQFSGGIVIEAKIGSRKPLFENRHAREQTHGFSFYVVGRGEQQLSVALEERSGNPAQHILCEGDGPVFQSDVDRRSAQRRPTDAKYPRRIQPDIAQLQIERLCRAGPVRLRLVCLSQCRLSRSCLLTPC